MGLVTPLSVFTYNNEKVIGGMILYLAVIEWLHCDLSFMH